MGPLGMPCIVQLSRVGDPIECLVLIVFRKASIKLGVERGEGIKQIFDDLQLGSVGIEVGHSGYQKLVLVE